MQIQSSFTKAQFFANYIGVKYENPHSETDIVTFALLTGIYGLDIKATLLLKPLDKITDEHARKLGWDDAADFFARSPLHIEATAHVSKWDLLRSHGYALEWMGITISQQLELGWIKLIV